MGTKLNVKNTPVVLSIAGSDTCAGAGIQADLKTLSALGVYGATVITALTAQNTKGVKSLFMVPTAFVDEQLKAVFDDMPVAVIKLGMLGSVETLQLIIERLQALPHIPTVLDPVMVSSSGCELLPATAIDYLRGKLIPLTSILTPNLSEAAVLLNTTQAQSVEQMRQQALSLLALGSQAVVIKGGHLESEQSVDVLASNNETALFTATRITSSHTHGTGCTLAAAIAGGLAKGLTLFDAVTQAKKYISGAIEHAQHLHVGQGRGPVQHFYDDRY